VRLLTLTGPGGIGKTRLSLSAANKAIDRFEHGVLFVDLSAARDTESVLAAIAHAIGLEATAAESLSDELRERLRDEHVLLILDNFEQVTQAAPTVAQLLQDCPLLKVLVTSREALHLRGEHLFAVPPLSLPRDARRPARAEQLAAYEAIQLFVERARAVKPDFRLTDESAAAVAEICRRLDGLPLALELATARINVFSPEALRDRLDDSLKLLRRGARDLPARQQTLHATIEWSYELLEPSEQWLFELLAAFSGATFEAVEAVAGSVNGHRATQIDTLDGLASLVDKSLVRHVGSNGDSRFVMLATIKEYAAERLRENSDFERAARRAHAAYFADFARRHWERARGDRREAALAALTANTDNLSVAWRHWLAERDLEQLNKLLDGLWAVYESEGRYRGMVDLARELLDVLTTTPATRERALQELTLRTSLARALTGLHGLTDEVEEEYRRALELFEGELEVPQLFPVLRGLSSLHGYRAEFDKALPLAYELLRLADAQGDQTTRVDAHLLVGAGLAFTNDLEGGDRAPRECDQMLRVAAPRLASPPARTEPRDRELYVRSACSVAARASRSRHRTREPRRHAGDRPATAVHDGLRPVPHGLPPPSEAGAGAGARPRGERRRRGGRVRAPHLEGCGNTPPWGGEDRHGPLRGGSGRYSGRRGPVPGLRTPPVFWPLLLYVRARACARARRPVEGLDFIDQAIEISGGAGTLPPLFFSMKGSCCSPCPRVAMAPSGSGAVSTKPRSLVPGCRSCARPSGCTGHSRPNRAESGCARCMRPSRKASRPAT
jgi:predicted ATPase